MAVQTVFKRYELKYLITAEQKQKIIAAIAPYMELDGYGRSSIRNIYYDTDSYLLIRRSIEKPVYKEKLRIRSYGRAGVDKKVYVELKKKYKSIVYKRRIAMVQTDALRWLDGAAVCPTDTQISREIDYFAAFYKSLRPVMFISYEREAYYQKDGGDFRVTFDDNILCRQDELSLDTDAYGTPILPEGRVLMEIKCSGGIPLWMTEVLSKERIYKTSFSKYGTAYKQIVLPQIGGIHNTQTEEACDD